MTTPILAVSGVQKSFGSVRALEDVTFEVIRGDVHALCGENGAGKSTLLKVLTGIYPHGSYTGEILFDGEPVNFRSVRDSERQGVGIIHRELTLCPNLSIAENIFLGQEIVRRGAVDWNETTKQAMLLLARVGLDEDPTTLVSSLGVGKQQLVEIAKALTRNTRLLLLDEPTAALNDNDADHLLDLVRRLQSGGTTCVIISHKLNEIRAIADRVTILRDGRSVETLTTATPECSDDRIIRSMVGRSVASLYPTRDVEPGRVRLEVKGWTVDHPEHRTRRSLDDVSFHVRAGEVVGFAGLVGAGRTELAMSVFGRSWGRYVKGEVEKDGRPVRLRSVSAAIDAGLAYVSEDRKSIGLNLISSIANNITAASTRGTARFGVMDITQEFTTAERFRRDLRIKAPSVSSIVGSLSGGNQQKVALAKWLETEPDILILDEPTRGIDVGAKAEIYEIINSLAADGRAVVVISSELPELLGLCDRIYTLCEGRVTSEVSRAEATQELLMQKMTTRSEETRVP